MKKIIAASAIVLASTTTAFAGMNENIEACAAKVEEFSGKTVDIFDAKYKKGGLFKWSEVEWNGILCKPVSALGVATVHNLWIDGEHVIVDGYAGNKAKAVAERIDADVDAAIETLEARIDILKGMRKEADDKLKANGVDADAVKSKIDSAIERVTQ